VLELQIEVCDSWMVRQPPKLFTVWQAYFVGADGKESGFVVNGKTTVANLVRCEVRTCAGSGINVTSGALATLERVLVEGSKGGDGVRVEGEGSQMQAKECRILRCQMHGVLACKGGTAELTQCETKQNKAAGFSSEGEGSQVTLAACASDFDAQVCTPPYLTSPLCRQPPGFRLLYSSSTAVREFTCKKSYSSPYSGSH
jgi:hypothetical protein